MLSVCKNKKPEVKREKKETFLNQIETERKIKREARSRRTTKMAEKLKRKTGTVEDYKKKKEQQE